MRSSLRRSLATIPAAAVLLTAADAQAQVERHIMRGSSVEIENVVGVINVERGSGSDVVVEIRRGGSSGSALRLDAGSSGGTESLRIVYPDDQLVYPRLGSRSRSSFNFGGRDGWSGGRRYEVRGTGSGTEAWADLRILVPAGKTVRVRLGVGEARIENVDADLQVSTSSGKIAASGTRGRLRLTSGSGSIEARDGRGEVQLTTGSGSVSARDLQGETISIRTGSGSVTASGLHSPRLTAGTGSGSLRLSRVQAGRVNASTGSGSVNVEMSSEFEDVRVSTGSGGVTLSVPERIGATVELRTGSGGIHTDFPITVTRTQRNHVRGTIGDGRSQIRVNTGSGGVRLQRS
jgi:lia operon protein LiaG